MPNDRQVTNLSSKIDTGEKLKAYLTSDSRIEEVIYVTSKNQKISRPRVLCKSCLYDWPLGGDKPPEKCANVHGYETESGRWVPPCGTRDWDVWPENFDPSNCDSVKAKAIWYLEQVERLRVTQEEKKPELRSKAS